MSMCYKFTHMHHVCLWVWVHMSVHNCVTVCSCCSLSRPPCGPQHLSPQCLSVFIVCLCLQGSLCICGASCSLVTTDCFLFALPLGECLWPPLCHAFGNLSLGQGHLCLGQGDPQVLGSSPAPAPAPRRTCQSFRTMAEV